LQTVQSSGPQTAVPVTLGVADLHTYSEVRTVLFTTHVTGLQLAQRYGRTLCICMGYDTCDFIGGKAVPLHAMEALGGEEV
jgi:hypothetical protein